MEAYTEVQRVCCGLQRSICCGLQRQSPHILCRVRPVIAQSPQLQKKFREAYREIQVSIEWSSASQLQTFCRSDRSNHGTTSLRLADGLVIRNRCRQSPIKNCKTFPKLLKLSIRALNLYTMSYMLEIFPQASPW